MYASYRFHFLIIVTTGRYQLKHEQEESEGYPNGEKCRNQASESIHT